MAKQIVIDYTPRNDFRDIHKQLESHRYNVLVAHRRFGKSVGLINHCIKMACKNTLRQPRYVFLAPFLKQAKMIAWEYLKYYTSGFPGARANESELYVEFMGRRIYLFGADNPDALRGTYWDGAIMDEFAQIKPEIWEETILPALSDRDGWAIFSGTPKGQNHFYETYQRAMRLADDHTWWAGMYRIDTTGIFTQEQIDLLRNTMSDNKFRQEYLCDFTASNDDILIPIDLVTAAANRSLRVDAFGASAKVFGIDVARFGGDKCVIFPRQGLQAFNPIVYEGIDNMTFANRVAYHMGDFNPKTVFIDAGRGEGVIDRLRQLGYPNIVEVNFGSKALDFKHYENRRSEMWDTGKKWLESGGAIPNNELLKGDLVAPTYSFNTRDKFQLESKADIKARLGRSPDMGDGFMLTFAAPVYDETTMEMRASRVSQTQFAQSTYNPLESFNRPYAQQRGQRRRQVANTDYNFFNGR